MPDPRPLFPVPLSGHVTVHNAQATHVFGVTCDDMDKADHDRLMAFFGSMRGRYGNFRFEHDGLVHESCSFYEDTARFTQTGPNAFCVNLPIEVNRHCG